MSPCSKGGLIAPRATTATSTPLGLIVESLFLYPKVSARAIFPTLAIRAPKKASLLQALYCAVSFARRLSPSSTFFSAAEALFSSTFTIPFSCEFTSYSACFTPLSRSLRAFPMLFLPLQKRHHKLILARFDVNQAFKHALPSQAHKRHQRTAVPAKYLCDSADFKFSVDRSRANGRCYPRHAQASHHLVTCCH